MHFVPVRAHGGEIVQSKAQPSERNEVVVTYGDLSESRGNDAMCDLYP